MADWFAHNWINLVLIAVIALACFLVIRGMIRDHKAGKHACGGNCASCGACGSCAGSCASGSPAPAGTKKGTRT